MDGDGSLVGVVDAGKEFQEGGFAGAVATDDADELAGLDFKVDAAEDGLFGVAFDAFEPV